jgi:hypothetical protein
MEKAKMTSSRDIVAKRSAEWREIARGNIERHLGDCEASEDSIYDEAYTLAFDALVDAGCPERKARELASEAAQPFAQS